MHTVSTISPFFFTFFEQKQTNKQKLPSLPQSHFLKLLPFPLSTTLCVSVCVREQYPVPFPLKAVRAPLQLQPWPDTTQPWSAQTHRMQTWVGWGASSMGRYSVLANRQVARAPVSSCVMTMDRDIHYVFDPMKTFQVFLWLTSSCSLIIYNVIYSSSLLPLPSQLADHGRFTRPLQPITSCHEQRGPIILLLSNFINRSSLCHGQLSFQSVRCDPRPSHSHPVLITFSTQGTFHSAHPHHMHPHLQHLFFTAIKV